MSLCPSMATPPPCVTHPHLPAPRTAPLRSDLSIREGGSLESKQVFPQCCTHCSRLLPRFSPRPPWHPPSPSGCTPCSCCPPRPLSPFFWKRECLSSHSSTSGRKRVEKLATAIPPWYCGQLVPVGNGSPVWGVWHDISHLASGSQRLWACPEMLLNMRMQMSKGK